MGFLFVFLFALFLPVLSFLGVGVAFAYGSTGLGTLAMGLVSFGLITEWHVRRRMYAASPLTEAEGTPPAKWPASWGRVDFSVVGRVAWSWSGRGDSRESGFLPQVKGAVALHVRKVTEDPHEQRVLSTRQPVALSDGRRRLGLPRPTQDLESRYDRVAVISEDASYLTLIARLLELDGWQTETYQEPGVALTAIGQERPDLVVLDCDVGPGVSGGDRTLDLLTLDPETSGIPVVACATDIETLWEAEQWLGDHGIVILPKPFDADDLSLAVHAAVDLAHGGQHEPFAVRAYHWNS